MKMNIHKAQRALSKALHQAIEKTGNDSRVTYITSEALLMAYRVESIGAKNISKKIVKNIKKLVKNA